MTTSTSSTVDEIQQRNATARGRVIAASDRALAEAFANDGEYGGSAEAVEAALIELAQVWVDEAQYFTDQKRRGWKSTAEELTRCAARLRGFAVGLTTRDVQMPPEPVASGLGPWKTIDGTEYATEEARDDVTHAVYPFRGCERHEQCRVLSATPLTIGEAEAYRDPVALRLTNEAITEARLTADNFLPETSATQLDENEAEPLTADNFLPEPLPVEHHAGEIREEGIELYVMPAAEPLIKAVAVDNPFTSPAAPGSARPPVKRLGYGELGQLIAATYPVPRPHLSHSLVESTERCGLSALLSDASRAQHLGPRRPSWSLLGGSAFHLAIESIERTAIELGGTSPLTTEWSNDVADQWESFWGDVLASVVDEQKAALIGTAYANPSTWHVANGGLEGFDWWRVEGLGMLRRYLEFHNNDWRRTHTLLQVPSDPRATQPTRVPVLEFPFTALAGSTSITTEGRIDAAWLSTTHEYPTATLEIVDHKAGKSVPSEHFQLTTYADVLRGYLPVNFTLPVVGRYWLARRGEYTAPVKLDRRAATPEIDYRYTMANRKVIAGVFEPSPSNFCASCSSVDYCPAQSMRDITA